MGLEFTKYQKAGFKLLLKHIRLKYPFILEIIPDTNSFERYGTMMTVSLKFDLEKFWESTGAYPDKKYEETPYLYTVYQNTGLYLFRYVADELREKFGVDYNHEIEDEINRFYKHLPDYMRLSNFEGWSDERIENDEFNRIGKEFYIKWREKKEPVKLSLNEWIPEFDIKKYYTGNI